MKAIRAYQFGPPHVLRLEDVPDSKPGAGQVLVQIKAAGVNPADTYVRSGSYALLPKLPYVPGGEGAGAIVEVGEGVRGWKAGDRVYVTGTVNGPLQGTCAEFAVCGASQIQSLPQRVSFAQGAAVHVAYATAYRSLFQRADARPGEWVLVHGASGGVGISCVQLARAHGLRVIGTAGTERGRQLVIAEGAHHVLDHSKPDYLAEIMAITDGHGVDLVMEMLANVNLDRDLGVLALRGRIVVIGNRGTVEINARQAMARDAAILGMVLWNTPEHEMASIHAALGAGLANGTLRPVVAQELPLKDAARAHEVVMSSGAHGKIVLVP
jgi:NADPH2:quinone reductase